MKTSNTTKTIKNVAPTSATKSATKKPITRKTNVKTNKADVKKVEAATPKLSAHELQELQMAAIMATQPEKVQILPSYVSASQSVKDSLTNTGAILYYVTQGGYKHLSQKDAFASWTMAAHIHAGFLNKDGTTPKKAKGDLQQWINIVGDSAFKTWKKLFTQDGKALNADGITKVSDRLAGKAKGGYNVNLEIVTRYLAHMKSGADMHQNGLVIKFMPVRAPKTK